MTQQWNINEAKTYGSQLLRGDLVQLRALQEEDLNSLATWWSSPEWSVLQQSTIRPRPLQLNAEMFRAWSKNESSEEIGFSVESIHSKQFVGHITLYGARLPERAATLSIIISPERVGQGIGTDAVKVMLRYAFLELGLNRVELRTFAFNSRAQKSYLKSGFKVEGTLREAIFHNGVHHDVCVMGILKSDWVALI